MSAQRSPAHVADEHTWSDLRGFLGRAHRVNADADARLRGYGPVLAAYVCPLDDDAVPTVVGLRVFQLARDWDGDVVSAVSAWLDRLNREENFPVLQVPPVETIGGSWAGLTAPRAGWRAEGVIAVSTLRAVAADGIEQVATQVTSGTGTKIASTVREQVWSAPLPHDDVQVNVPAAAAFTGEVLGFWQGLADHEVATVSSVGAWLRVSTPHGHLMHRTVGPLLA